MDHELEKRKFHRLEFPLDVSIEILSAQEKPKGLPPMLVRSRNISKHGICLETKSIEVCGVNLLSGLPFARDNRLRMSIDLKKGDPPLAAIGEVRWYDIDRDIPEYLCRLGVAFLTIKDDGRNRLAKFLKHARE